MADAIEIPAITTAAHVFTPANAREMQRRGVEKRMRNKALREAQLALLPKLHDVMTPSQPSFIQTRARKLEKEIDRVLAQLAACESAKETQALAMALDRLFGAYAYMTGLERPGVSRGKRKSTASNVYSLPSSPE